MSKAARKTRGIMAVLVIVSLACAGLFTVPPATDAVAQETNPISAYDSHTVYIASIDISKTVNPASQYRGRDVTYTITVTNNGGADLYNVAVTDPMLLIDENIGDLAVGASWTKDKTYTIPSSAPLGSYIENTASVIGYYDYYGNDEYYSDNNLEYYNGENGEYSRYVTDEATARVLVRRPGGGGGTSGGGGDDITTTTPNETVKVPTETPMATPQGQPSTIEPQPEAVTVPAEKPVTVPKGDLPFTGGNPAQYAFAGLVLAALGTFLRHRFK